MQIILKEDIHGLGKRGEIKSVKSGYFKNFLFPRGKATIATEGRIRMTERLREAIVLEKQELEKHAKEIAEKLESMKFTVEAKASAKGKLFGAIDEKKVCNLVREQAKIEVTPDQVNMEKHLKETGDHKVELRLAPGVKQTITINIKASA